MDWFLSFGFIDMGESDVTFGGGGWHNMVSFLGV